MSFVCLLLSSLSRLSSVSVMLDFSDSLNDVAPVFPILLPVNVRRNERSELLMDVFCVSSFLLFSLPRSSFVSVVFDFSASLNDVTPVSPMLLPVDATRKGKSELLMDVFCVSSFFRLHHLDRAEQVLCLISMLHSTMLFLFLQCC